MSTKRRLVPALALLLGLPAACSDDPATTATSPAPLGAVTPPPGGADASTFRERVFYELWVRSFQDSNGDGIGDLPGLIDRLDELQALGIGGIWLMPTFPSPLADSGYDVADYTAVHPDYGSLDDMRALLAAAHERGILVYLDMVFNHTSDQHEWFQSALTGPASPYFDFYRWSPTPGPRCADVIAGPFGATRWTYRPEVGQYYFHGFYPRQPDLNFANPAVQEALLDVLRFWMDLGVDGFRFDVPDRFFEDGEDCAFVPATRNFHARLRRTISGTGTLHRGFVGEIWGTQGEVKPYFGADGNPMIFNFELLFSLYTAIAVGQSPRPIAEQVQLMLHDLPAESRWGIVAGNHDTPRFADIAGGDEARQRLLLAVQLTLPGVPFLWMGDELGLTMGEQVNVDWRDGSRTPMPWTTAAPGFGFTGEATPHLAFGPGAAWRAWHAQRLDPGSLLNLARRLISLRNASPALRGGAYRQLHAGPRLWAYERTRDGERVVVVHNFHRREAETWAAPGLGRQVRDLLSGATLPAARVPLAPGQSRLLVGAP